MKITETQIKQLSSINFKVTVDDKKIEFIDKYLEDNKVEFLKEAIDYGRMVAWKRLASH